MDGKLRARALAALLAATAVVALAGCAGSSHSSTGGSGGATPASGTGGDSVRTLSGSASAQANALKLSRCMRAHGVPNFPDPKSGGQLTLTGTGVNRNSPAFQSGSRACQSLMHGGPGGVGPSGQKSDMTRAQGLSLARCVRAHGVPTFPDPSASGGFAPGSVNPNSPQVKRALGVCLPRATAVSS